MMYKFTYFILFVNFSEKFDLYAGKYGKQNKQKVTVFLASNLQV